MFLEFFRDKSISNDAKTTTIISVVIIFWIIFSNVKDVFVSISEAKENQIIATSKAKEREAKVANELEYVKAGLQQCYDTESEVILWQKNCAKSKQQPTVIIDNSGND